MSHEAVVHRLPGLQPVGVGLGLAASVDDHDYLAHEQPGRRSVEVQRRRTSIDDSRELEDVRVVELIGGEIAPRVAGL